MKAKHTERIKNQNLIPLTIVRNGGFFNTQGKIVPCLEELLRIKKAN